MGKVSLYKINKDYYDKIWSHSKLMHHGEWPVWSLLKLEARPGLRMLELGPGMRPKIPVKGSWFIEASSPARYSLERQGARILRPWDGLLLKKDFFDVVCAFEVLEHIKNDAKLLNEINLSMRKNGKLFISVPIFKKYWTDWDRVVGHYRRYLPKELGNLLTKTGFEVECYAEDSFARAYTGKISQKVAKLFFKAFPSLSLYFERHIIRILCWYARNFSPLKWKKGSLEKIPASWAGVYIACRKIK